MINKPKHYLSVKEIKKTVIKDTVEKLCKEYYGPFFQSLRDNYRVGLIQQSNPKVFIKNVASLDDLECFPTNSPGLYLILTDYQNGFNHKNPCSLNLNNFPNVRVIYRGEAYNVHLRLKSHLFNSIYNEEREREIQNNIKREDNYTVCLKLPNRNQEGINLHVDNELARANWFVAYHGMRNSDSFLRKVGEKAFDDEFGKPICSMEQSIF